MIDTELVPTSTRFAAWRQKTRDASPPLLPKADSAQRRLWMQEQLEPHTARYNCPHALRAQGPLPAPALEQALARLARRHEALRSSFELDDRGELRRRVSPALSPPLDLLDLSHGGLGLQEVESCLRQLLARPFDLAAGPLWRAGCIRLAQYEHIVYVSAHHAIVDDWSVGILLRELILDVEGALEGRPLPPDARRSLPAAVDASRVARALTYWRERLAGVPALLLPVDRARAARPARRAEKVFRHVPDSLTQALDERAHEAGVTPFSVFLTALRSVLSTWSRQTDFTIGVPAFDRRSGGAETQVGLAVSLLPLRRAIDSSAPFWAEAAAEFEALMAALDHREAPFDEIVEAVAAARVAGTDPLVQVMYAHHERAEGHFSAGSCRFSPIDVVLPHARFELTLMTVRVSGGLSISAEYDAALFDRSSVEQLLEDFTAVLAIAAQSLAAPLCPAPARPAQVRAAAAPATTTAVPLASRLRRTFAGRPDTIALRYAGDQYSFRWLGGRAEGIAQRLRREGAGAEVVVAIAMPRGPLQVSAICGTVLAGAAFALFDPHAPAERLMRLMSALAPRFLLVSRDGPTLLAPPSARVIEVDALPPAGVPQGEPPAAQAGLAYVVATSGSTGHSKLIGAPHGGLLNRLDWMKRLEPWAGDERALSRTQTMFVDFICETLAPLAAGVPLVIAESQQLADAQALVDLMRRERTTRLTATPSLLRELASALPPSALPLQDLRVVVASGEALTPQDAARARRLSAARLWNLYGSSEVAADATAALIDDGEDGAAVPIGLPIDGMGVWLTDPRGRAVPWRSVGEMRISGPGVARGYLGDPVATAVAFQPAPGLCGARTFVTGDHGRLDAQGRLLFAGREAGRVELRGIRVEIHEMEALLRDDPEVRHAAVVVVDAPRRAVARVQPRRAGLDAQSLRRRLLARAPAYLVPGQIEIGDLPRTPSGKIDYVALRQCPREAPREGPPRTPTEQALADAWREVLHCAVDDRGADFFGLGGHSLAAARIARLLTQRLGREVPVALSLVNPVLRDAAASLDELPATQTATIRRDDASRFEPFALHPLQAAYVAGRGTAFAGGGVSLHGYSEIELLQHAIDQFEDALNVLIERHDMLRAVLVGDDGQRVLPAVPRYRIERVDLRGQVRADVEALQARLRVEMASQVHDLRHWPSFDFRATLCDHAPPRLHVSFDGVFVDASSQSVLLRELGRLLRDGDPGWRPPGIRYRDWLTHRNARRSELDQEQAWADWQARLPTLPEAPDLPYAEQRPPAGPPRIVQMGIDIPADTVRRLRERLAGDGNLVTVLLAAFVVVLARFSSRPRFIVNVPISGRGTAHEDIDRVVGAFGDFTLLAFDVAAAAGFRDVVRAARRELTWALERQVVSGMDLSRALRQQRGGQILAPIVFTSLNFEADGAVAPAETLFEEFFSAGQTPQVNLDNRVRLRSDGTVQVTWDVAVDRFPPGLAQTMLAAYRDALQSAAGRRRRHGGGRRSADAGGL